jgi:hypothetical protein
MISVELGGFWIWQWAIVREKKGIKWDGNGMNFGGPPPEAF